MRWRRVVCFFRGHNFVPYGEWVRGSGAAFNPTTGELEALLGWRPAECSRCGHKEVVLAWEDEE